MGVKHMNKAFTLPLNSREKFVLLALARYASNDDDTCYPGIPKLSEMISSCEKTVKRGIKELNRLGIIDINIGPYGNNVYTLYLTGDIDSWEEYLQSQKYDSVPSLKTSQSPVKDSETHYKVINNKNEKLEEKEVLVAGEVSPAIETTPDNLFNPEESFIQIPPGKRKSAMENYWFNIVPKYYKGMDPILLAKDRWAIEDIYNYFKKASFPVYDWLEFTIANWSSFVNFVRKNDRLWSKYGKKEDYLPNLFYLSANLDVSLHLFMLELGEQEK